MKLVIKYKKSLKDFVKKEMNTFSKIYTEISPGIAIIEADYKQVLTNSGLIEEVNKLIGYTNDFKELDLKNLIPSSESFKVKCKDKKVCINLGQLIKDTNKASVDLENPDHTIIVEKINDKFLIYLKFLDSTLSQRGYTSSNTEFLTGDIARAIVEFSGWDNNGVIVDLFCHEGYILIEAALKGLNVGPGFFKSKELNFEIPSPKITKLNSEIICMSNSMSDLKYSKQNAKLARVFKYFKFMFHDLEDIDYKLKENTVDYVLSAVPKKINMEKLFFQLEYVMKKKGVVVFYSNNDLSVCEEFGFKIVEELIIEDKKLVKLVKE